MSFTCCERSRIRPCQGALDVTFSLSDHHAVFDAEWPRAKQRLHRDVHGGEQKLKEGLDGLWRGVYLYPHYFAG